jgi:hypothetical protein
LIGAIGDSTEVYLELCRLPCLPLVDDEDGVTGPDGIGGRVHLDGVELAPVRGVLTEGVEARILARRSAGFARPPFAASLHALFEYTALPDGDATLVDVAWEPRKAARRLSAVRGDVEPRPRAARQSESQAS